MMKLISCTLSIVFNMLPINYMLDLQKLSLLNMQREHFLPIGLCMLLVVVLDLTNYVESMVLLICVVIS